MHQGPTFMGGPVYWLFMIVMYGAGLLSLWLIVDATRPKRAAAFAEHPWSRWAWMAPQVAYFVLFVLENLPWTATGSLGVTLVVSTPVVIVLQIVYLLRVAYPSPSRLAARELAAHTVRSIPEEPQP